MSYKRNDLTISAAKYAAIIGVEKSDFVKMMEHKKVPSVKKGEFDLNSAIAAVEPHIQREEIVRKVHAFFISKGGTGKTSTVFTMGHYLALLGYRCLLIDLDPQCNLSTVCGISFDELGNGDDILEVLRSDKTVSECIVPIIRNVDLIKGSEVIGEADIALNNKAASDYILQRKFKSERIHERYDFIFFDSHSAHSKATNNAMFISDSIISVINPDMFSYNGIQPVISTTEDISLALNRDVRFSILINNFEPNQANQKEVVKKLVADYGDYILSNFVKRSADFVRATMENKPFYCFSGNNSNAIKDYSGLLEEFIDISSRKIVEAQDMEVVSGQN